MNNPILLKGDTLKFNYIHRRSKLIIPMKGIAFQNTLYWSPGTYVYYLTLLFEGKQLEIKTLRSVCRPTECNGIDYGIYSVRTVLTEKTLGCFK